ncbi:unnamed protein product [Hymenolepis diminuta]|uniref:EGF-like domain-containing protein n=1 Tax=Hymenolepis diminuta TaxID=6216 RepID=A0A0R3SW72_HYMDI|nr:unnamed protein product [Hymenolepis diminuta]
MSACLLLVLFCATSSGIVVIPGDDIEYVDAENPVEIFLPKEFYIDMSNRIVIHSLKPIFKVCINISIGQIQMRDIGNTVFVQLKSNRSVGDLGHTYILKYFMPVQLPPSTIFILKFTYWYCSADNCFNKEDIIKRTVERDVKTVRRYILIVGETDKTIYQPNELVRFRFIAITSRQLVPRSEPPYWPAFKIVGNGWDRISPISVNPDEHQKYLQSPIFDSIEVRDPTDKLEMRLETVDSMKASNLSYRISAKAKEGYWKIIARARMSSKVINISVKTYTVPWLRAKVTLPDIIRLNDYKATAELCAEHKNGSPVRGTFTAQFCICDQHILEGQYEKGKLFPMNMCVDIFNKRTRFCKKIDGILHGTKCSNISINIPELVKGEAVLWTEKLGAFVEINELDAGKTVVTFEVCKFEDLSEPLIKLEIPNTYKTGIPIIGEIIYRNTGRRENEELEIIVREVVDACNRWKIPLTENPIRLIRLISVKPHVEKYDFSLPPLYLKNPIHITVQQRKNFMDSNMEPLNPTLNISNKNSWSNPPQAQWDLSASKILDLWDNNLGPAIQVNVVDNSNNSCPRSVMLGVISNEPISKNTTLTLYFLSHGRLSKQEVILNPEYLFIRSNNVFGHNNSTDSGRIQCLNGWTGANCLTPVCEKDCGEGGLCAAPRRCVCKPGWSGDMCEIGPRRKYYPVDKNKMERNGTHKSGLINKDMNGDHIPRRVTYIYTATLELDSDFGPEFRAVASIFVNGRLVTDFIKIDKFYSCSSSKMLERSITLEIGKQTVIPGEKINISLVAENRKDSMICLLSIATVEDIIDSHKIYPDSYPELLKGYRDLGLEESIKGTEDAFRAADIECVQVLSKRKVSNSERFPLDCSYSGFLGQLAIEGPSAASEFPGTDPVKGGISRYMKKVPRSLDRLPEVLLFEAVSLREGSFNKSLTVPSGLNTWEVNAFCFTSDRDIWIPKVKANFTTQMPFYIDFSPPVSVKRNEILHLKINIVTTVSRIDSFKFNCYDLNVSVEVDSQYLQIIGSSSRSASICFRDGTAQNTFEFQIPVRTLRIGRFKITAKVVAKQNRFMLSYECDTGIKDDFLIKDAIQRTLQVISEGVEKKVTSNRILCLPEIGASPLSLVLSKLNSSNPLPTGYGQNNLAYFAPNVYILRYILQNQYEDIVREEELRNLLIRNIIRGLDNQIQFYHSKTGGFSNLGESYGDRENIWLTASAFQIFSEAAKLPLAALSESRMFVVTIQLPTGWMVKLEELNITSSKERIHKFELDSMKQEVNAYFISTNDNESIDTTTCFTVNFYHNMVIENMQPGLMTVRDLKNPERIVQKYLKLDSCHVNLNSNESLILISDKVKQSPNALPNLLNSSLCHNNLTLNIFKPLPKYTAGNLLFGSVYSFQSNGTFVSWNTTVHFSGDFEKLNGPENGKLFQIEPKDIGSWSLRMPKFLKVTDIKLIHLAY